MIFREFLDEKKKVCNICGDEKDVNRKGHCASCEEDKTKKKTNDGMFIYGTKKKPAMYSPAWLKKHGYE